MVFLKSGAESPVLDKVLGPIGILLDGKDLVDRVQSGNFAAALVSLLSGGTTLASWAGAASLGPLGLGFAALSGFVDITIPVSAEQQDDTLAMGAEHMFGKKMSDLSSEEMQALDDRYQGILGPVMMISDTMDATAKKIFPWNWGK
jgi:hypothetical protein